MTTEPLELFNGMASAIARSAAESQWGRSLQVTTEPHDILIAEGGGGPGRPSVKGSFMVLVDGAPGTMTAALTPEDEPGHFEFRLAVVLDGAEEEIVFTATVEDTVGLRDAYEALLDTEADEQNDLA
ncbi:hypothetical protein [Roseomonas populi]|uniref:SRPBCC family protein n=1 Tax=Roseomonas populi TaxID=3121582 RepID=A0ABT1X667_9PROT|nr:hypothetical protein [Roseomonas pecuniae]MCR0983602.1 hypothetical protein [Roseomonas pecuniae]